MVVSPQEMRGILNKQRDGRLLAWLDKALVREYLKSLACRGSFTHPTALSSDKVRMTHSLTTVLLSACWLFAVGNPIATGHKPGHIIKHNGITHYVCGNEKADDHIINAHKDLKGKA